MKGKKIVTSVLAVATGCICLFTSGCELFGIDGGGETEKHEHTGWAYVNTDENKHWESPSCHPDVKRSEGSHDYDDNDDDTCDTCGHEREIDINNHKGWTYHKTDPDKHWEYATCHPDVRRNEGPHVYDNDEDATCVCGYTRVISTPGHTHEGWAYVSTDPVKHWESPSCHPDVKRNEENHVYDNDSDAECNICRHVREIQQHSHTWEYTFNDEKHWEYATCHPDVTGNEAPHEFENDTDTTCDTCGYVREIKTEPPQENILTYKHAGEESAAFEWNDTNAKGAKVEYRPHSGPTAYVSIDGDLIRQKNSATARADILGLMGNTLYDFKVTTSAGKSETVESVKISAYDRAGSYAHFKYTGGVGAYKDDGTPKANAVIVYVNETNKNTVQEKVNGTTYTGIVSILKAWKNADSDSALIVRVIGTVGAATWKKLVENNDQKLTPDLVLGKDGKTKLVDKYNIDRSTYNSTTKKYEGGTSKDITQAQLIEDKINELDESVYKELKGLNSKIKYDASKDEFDSCWNDCNIEYAKNVTIEGVGEDAKIFQWGFTFKNSNSIEVRNLTFDDYTEDACSFEASDTGASSLDGFSTGNIWVHNNTFEEGNNYWDVCNEQDKHDGDGSTDFKGLKNITISYNVYNKTHKTGLIGGGNSHATANVTFHHNWYNGCKARLPLGRQANMHMYNNYYNATTSCAISLRAGAYALIENCYFDTASKATSVELQEDSTYGDGAAKMINCINDSGSLPANTSLDHYFFGTNRTAKVTNDNKFSKTFDTDSSLFYYSGGKSQVGLMLEAADVPDYVKLHSGVAKRSNNTAGGDTDEPEIPGNPAPQVTLTTDDLDASVRSQLMDTYVKITQPIALGSGIIAIEPTENADNNSWKLYSNGGKLTQPYLQCDKAGTITIDLTNYTGSIELVIVARTSGSNDEGRYYTITGTNYSQTVPAFTNSDRENTFTLKCGYKYTLTCSNGMRFKSFAISPV